MSEKIVNIGGQTKAIAVDRDGDTFRAGTHEVTVVGIRGNIAELRVDERTHVVPFVMHEPRVSFAFDGETYIVDITEKGSPARAKQRDHSMSAPMPGVVLSVHARPGQKVKRGDLVCVVEAQP